MMQGMGLRNSSSQAASQPFSIDAAMQEISSGADLNSVLQRLMNENPDAYQQVMQVAGVGAGGGQPAAFTNLLNRTKKESPLQKANDSMSIGGMLGGLFGGGGSGGSGGGSGGGGFGGFFGG